MQSCRYGGRTEAYHPTGVGVGNASFIAYGWPAFIYWTAALVLANRQSNSQFALVVHGLYFLPGLWLAGGVLLLGGAAFATAERLLR
jgi:hypothetical protein